MRAITSDNQDVSEQSIPVLLKAHTRASSERQMRTGRRLVLSGFVVAVAGIVAYCVACLTAGRDPAVGAYLTEHAGVLVGPALGIIGAGTLMWLLGSFMYLRAAMDADPDVDPADL